MWLPPRGHTEKDIHNENNSITLHVKHRILDIYVEANPGLLMISKIMDIDFMSKFRAIQIGEVGTFYH